jgi:Tfp pilus assembly protein PilN
MMWLLVTGLAIVVVGLSIAYFAACQEIKDQYRRDDERCAVLNDLNGLLANRDASIGALKAEHDAFMDQFIRDMKEAESIIAAKTVAIKDLEHLRATNAKLLTDKTELMQRFDSRGVILDGKIARCDELQDQIRQLKSRLDDSDQDRERLRKLLADRHCDDNSADEAMAEIVKIAEGHLYLRSKGTITTEGTKPCSCFPATSESGSTSETTSQ